MPKRSKDSQIVRIPLPGSAGRDLELRINHVPRRHGSSIPSYTYTTGLLDGVRHPEIIVFGLKKEEAVDTLTDLAKRIVEGNETFRVNHVYTDIFLRHRAVFHEITPAQAKKYVGQPEKKGHTLKILQLIWPDRNNRFPWEPGFEEHLRELQPILGLH